MRRGGEAGSDDEEDVPLASLATFRARKWCFRNPTRKGESKEEYRKRVEAALLSGLATRRELKKTKKSALAVSVVAGVEHDKETGDKEEEPYKVLDKRETDAGVEYYCWWHDVGFADQDEKRWVSAEDALAWKDKIDDFEASVREKETEDEWSVKAIVNKRMHKGQIQYHVDWNGTDSRGKRWPRTWEPIEHLGDCKHLIDSYNAKHTSTQKKGKKRKKKSE